MAKEGLLLGEEQVRGSKLKRTSYLITKEGLVELRRWLAIHRSSVNGWCAAIPPIVPGSCTSRRTSSTTSSTSQGIGSSGPSRPFEIVRQPAEVRQVAEPLLGQVHAGVGSENLDQR
jgi:DNA-binding PadR family transcriptional regulator